MGTTGISEGEGVGAEGVAGTGADSTPAPAAGGGGGLAALLHGETGVPAQAGAQAGEGGTAPATGEAGSGGWFAPLGISDQGDADNPSNSSWMGKKGFKTPDEMVTSYRALETKVGGQSLVVPGENATPEERETFYKLLGKPETVDGYAAPEIPDGQELDQGLFTDLRDQAFAAGIPKAMFDQVAKGLIARQVDELAAWEAQQESDTAAKMKEWGAGANENLVQSQRATRQLTALGWSREDTLAVAGVLGSGKWLELTSQLGAGLAEDSLINPNSGKASFSVSVADAKSRLQAITNDPVKMGIYDKMVLGEPGAKAQWAQIDADRKRLTAIVARGEEQNNA